MFQEKLEGKPNRLKKDTNIESYTSHPANTGSKRLGMECLHMSPMCVCNKSHPTKAAERICETCVSEFDHI